MRCPLCETDNLEILYEDTRRFYGCQCCGLACVAPQQFLSREAERSHYDRHENSPLDLRYRRFLSRLCTPLLELLAPRSLGLDFGSGPGPTLSIMFAESGHRMAIYDPYYAPQPSVFEDDYDFITASEVVEHLHAPRVELNRLWECLRPGGYLGIMTKRLLGRQEFERWHYKNDPTHVCFFALSTFQWLADQWQAELLVPADDVVLLRKRPRNSVSGAD